MKIDCSKTLNYVNERNRMCDVYVNGCEGCPLEGTGTCGTVRAISQEYIDIVQKWSDEHPRETMLERFWKLMPYAPIEDDGTPSHTCPYHLGWADDEVCPKEWRTETITCVECWNRPYIERENENA